MRNMPFRGEGGGAGGGGGGGVSSFRCLCETLMICFSDVIDPSS